MKNKLFMSVAFLLLVLPIMNQGGGATEIDTTKVGVLLGEEYWFSVTTNNYTHPSSGEEVGFPLLRNSFAEIVIEEGELLGFSVLNVTGNNLYASYAYGTPGEFDNVTIVQKTTAMNIIRKGLVIFNDWTYWEDIWNVPIYGKTLVSGIVNREIVQNDSNFTVIITTTYGFLVEYELKEVYVYEKTTGVLLEARTTKQVVRGTSDAPIQEQTVVRIERPSGIRPFEEKGSSSLLSWNPWFSLLTLVPLASVIILRRKK